MRFVYQRILPNITSQRGSNSRHRLLYILKKEAKMNAVTLEKDKQDEDNKLASERKTEKDDDFSKEDKNDKERIDAFIQRHKTLLLKLAK